MTKLTPEAYANCRGVKCPNCGSDQLEGDSFDVEAGSCVQEVGCNDCGASWYDVYELTGYANLENPTEGDDGPA